MSKIYYSFVFIFIFLIFLFQNTTAEYDSSTVYQETYYNDFLPSDSLKSIEELSINIDNLLKINSKNLATTKFGIGIYSVNQKKWYYQKNPDLY